MDYDSEYAPRTHVHAELYEARAELQSVNEELAAAMKRLDIVESLLDECRDLLKDQYADADCEDGRFVPNQAMRLSMEIDEVLK